ncbi:MAG: phosphatase PAP2 family protein [Elusimicrobia bacterium]|nr:phosphatase PAP2 family protein [Elusimicrobiota bacterium]
MKLRKSLLLAAVPLLLAAPALCGEWVVEHTTYYIAADQQQFPDFPPPPAPGSPEDRADLKAVFDWQVKHTEAQCEAVRAQRYARFNEFFGDISPFPEPLPEEAAEIFKRVRKETDGMVVYLKERFNRPRPFRRDPALVPCAGRDGGLSYPSGHSTISRVFGRILSDLVPERKAEFMAHADQAALNRVIGGVHHPSDVEAGKKLGDLIYARYKKSKAFRADMKELKRLLAKPAAKAREKAAAR